MSKKRSVRRSLESFRERSSLYIRRKSSLNAMPAGADTRCEAGDFAVTTEEAGYLLEYEDYPLSSPEQAADTIVERAGL